MEEDGKNHSGGDKQKATNDLSIEKVYEQVNENWRFLAKWRQLALAGYLALLAGALSLFGFVAHHEYPRQVIGFCFLFLAWICWILRIIDKRTHRLTTDACKAGVGLEDEKRPGFFRVNDATDKEQGVKHNLKPAKGVESHSFAAAFLLLGSSAIFTLLGLYLFVPPRWSVTYWMGENAATWEYTVVPLTVTSTGASLGPPNITSDGGWEFVAVGNDSKGGSFVILRRHKR